MEKSEYVRETPHVSSKKSKMRKPFLKWFGHILRRENNYFRRTMMAMDQLNKKERKRLEKRFVDAVKDNVKVVKWMKEDAINRKRRKTMICYGDPRKRKR